MAEDIRENDEIIVPGDIQFEEQPDDDSVLEESSCEDARVSVPPSGADRGSIEENDRIDDLKILSMDGAFPMEPMLAIFTIQVEGGEQQRIGIPGMFEYVHERFVHLSGKPASDHLNEKVVEYVRNKMKKGDGKDE